MILRKYLPMTNGYVSIEAEHYAKKTDAVRWEKTDDYGRMLSCSAR